MESHWKIQEKNYELQNMLFKNYKPFQVHVCKTCS